MFSRKKIEGQGLTRSSARAAPRWGQAGADHSIRDHARFGAAARERTRTALERQLNAREGGAVLDDKAELLVGAHAGHL